MPDFGLTLATGKDLLGLVLSRGDELGIGVSDREAEAKVYLQVQYVQFLASGFPWPFARKTPPGVFTTDAEITTGTATVTPQSATVTLTAAPTGSVANWKFFVDGEPTIYRVLAHTAASVTLTLDSPYVGTQGAGSAYHLVHDEVDLAADFLAFQGRRAIRDHTGRTEVLIIAQQELQAMAPSPTRAGDFPSYAALIGATRIRLWPWSTTPRRYEYDYTARPAALLFDGSASDVTVITPIEHNMVLVYKTLTQLLVDKEDSRATVFAGLGQGLEATMQRHALRSMRLRQWSAPGSAVGTRR